jgi:hypothetical protein
MKKRQLKEIIREETRKILKEMIVSQPKSSSVGFPLHLKIGKYDVSKGRLGKVVNFNSKEISSPTRNRVMSVFDKLEIQPEKSYVAWMVTDDGFPMSGKSTFVVSSYKGEPIIMAQTQTNDPRAGQMYLYSKYFKSGKSLRLPDPTQSSIENSRIFADKNATKEQILQALKYDNL